MPDLLGIIRPREQREVDFANDIGVLLVPASSKIYARLQRGKLRSMVFARRQLRC
jgi:hypothetical protein